MTDQWISVLEITVQLIAAVENDDWISVEKRLVERQNLLEQIKNQPQVEIDEDVARKILQADKKLVEIFEAKYQDVIAHLSEISNSKKIKNIYNQNT